jgi:phosphatidate cytidylyltransferase
LGRLALTKLQKRILSALVLMPVSLWMIWYGGLPFIAFLLVLTGISLYEILFLSLKTKHKVLFSGLGVTYIIGSFLCCYFIRHDYPLLLGVLFICMVWASDIGAYFFGKSIGGPKLSPAISPNKTWAGFAGAVICPVVLALAYFLWHGSGLTGFLLFAALIIGVATGASGQAGDLVISFIKRRAQVKDSGQIIPGHGGLLDRIDAMLLSAPVFLFIISRFPDVFFSG